MLEVPEAYGPRRSSSPRTRERRALPQRRLARREPGGPGFGLTPHRSTPSPTCCQRSQSTAPRRRPRDRDRVKSRLGPDHLPASADSNAWCREGKRERRGKSSPTSSLPSAGRTPPTSHTTAPTVATPPERWRTGPDRPAPLSTAPARTPNRLTQSQRSRTPTHTKSDGSNQEVVVVAAELRQGHRLAYRVCALTSRRPFARAWLRVRSFRPRSRRACRLPSPRVRRRAFPSGRRR